ncbi:putative membrane protein YkoI [Acetoanaerobium pronyense]|uniref:Membrane protein YkoI n=1 Tax=Acetoanaerobium pronyense TaxID=1482736 RepID=A0ABS4KMP3_9FIRM|nr:stalk domain-containing protein [Acetoanaerobium pronyense]MBP2029043.1 putative membrane protein YkoI [Acetoanaerobium pronyense]
MKHILKFLSLVMALAVMLSAPMASFARGGNLDAKEKLSIGEALDMYVNEDEDDDDEDEDNDDEMDLEKLLSKDDILKIVKGLADGRVVKMKLDEDDDTYIYEIEVKGQGAEYEIEIDAVTGQVLEMEVDEEDAEEEDKSLPEAITEDEATRIALEAVGGTLLEIEADDLDEEDGKYEVKIMLDGVEHEVEINAFTGEIMEIDQKEMDNEDEDADDEDGKDAPAWGHIKNDLQLQRRVLKEKMKSIREQMDEFEKSMEDALEMGDPESVESFQKMIGDFQTEMEMQKLMSKQMVRDMQEMMRNKYSADEWEMLEKNKEEIGDIPGIRVMPAESILMPEGNLKFDVPPVIKNSRMLVPIRAISEALDAEVSWDNDTRTATIVTDEHTIVIAVSNETILVNGEPVETDVPAEIIKGRIVVPLRFIIENMGLDIEWDQETETAEILGQ